MKETLGGGTYWFVSALILCELFIFLLLISRRKGIWFYSVVLLALSIFEMWMGNVDEYHFYAYPQAFLACCFVGAGGLYWRYEKLFEKLRFWHWAVLLIAYIVIFTFYPHTAKVLVSMQDVNIFGVISSLLGCLVLVKVCKMAPKLRILTFIGTHSLVFYLFSGALPIVANILFKRLFPTSTFGNFMLYYITIVAGATALTYIIQRYMPFLLDLRVLNKENGKEK